MNLKDCKTAIFNKPIHKPNKMSKITGNYLALPASQWVELAQPPTDRRQRRALELEIAFSQTPNREYDGKTRHCKERLTRTEVASVSVFVRSMPKHLHKFRPRSNSIHSKRPCSYHTVNLSLVLQRSQFSRQLRQVRESHALIPVVSSSRSHATWRISGANRHEVERSFVC